MEQTSQIIDNKVVKRHYPRVNNDSALGFTFEPDPNLCLIKNKILINFTIDLDKNYIPDNGFASKLFSLLQVEVNSQIVSSNKTKYGTFF